MTIEEAKRRNLSLERFTRTSMDWILCEATRQEWRMRWRERPEKPGIEDSFYYLQADTAAYGGQMAKAREFAERAVASATHADERRQRPCTRQISRLNAAGNAEEAKKSASEGLRLATNRDINGAAGLALALAGDASVAQKIMDELTRIFRKIRW